jgi:hypothetical protein
MSTDAWSTTDDAGASSGDECGHDPEARAGALALEGPFVAVAPGVWVRASRVCAVARATSGAGDQGDQGDQGDGTGSRVYVLGADPTAPAPGFASPHPVDALVTALRMPSTGRRCAG